MTEIRSLADPAIKPDSLPTIVFKYQMPHDFLTCAEGMLKKFNW